MTWTLDSAVEFLTIEGDLGTPACLYGSRSSDCAPVAYVLALVLVENNEEAVMGERLLDYCMGLVVNSHDDVESLLSEYARTVGWNFDTENHDVTPIEENPDMSESAPTTTVLIHLNIQVEVSGTETAEDLAREYLYRHNIPVDDVAAIDPQ